MTRSQLVAGGLIVASAVFAYLLTQPDVILPPLVKVLLGGANVAVTTLSLFLKIQPPAPEVTVPGGNKPVA